ncbi:MAG: hypothetical protein HY023_17655 [Chloroflexi bacterium]|nr:hypothetical protein [Chloroflexota bacterium]
MSYRFYLNVTLLVALGLLLYPRPARAQENGFVSGVVFLDANGNGARDPGEIGVANAAVNFASGSNAATEVTNTDGTFQHTTPLGTWTVTVVPPAGYQVVGASAATANITAQNQNLEINFGVRLAQLATNPPPTVPVPTNTPGVLPQTGAPVTGSSVLLLALIAAFVAGVALVISAWTSPRK